MVGCCSLASLHGSNSNNYLLFFACYSSHFLPTKVTSVAVVLEFTYLVYKYFAIIFIIARYTGCFSVTPPHKGNPLLLPRHLHLI